jgi:hypothetical protein
MPYRLTVINISLPVQPGHPLRFSPRQLNITANASHNQTDLLPAARI